MDPELVTVDRPASGVARIALNRPERLNALTHESFGALGAAFERTAGDPATRTIVVTGAGRGFCSGIDLESGVDGGGHRAPGGVPGGLAAQARVASAITMPRRLRVPVVAAVNGVAAGGGLALALACDVRIAAASARFGASFVRLGLSGGDCGVSYLLPRIVGASVAFELMLSGRLIDADEALKTGLVTRVVEDDGLADAAVEVARAIAANSPFGVEMTKRVMWANLEAAGLDHAIELENRTQVLATFTDDMGEALAAFAQRRPPRFEGR